MMHIMSKRGQHIQSQKVGYEVTCFEKILRFSGTINYTVGMFIMCLIALLGTAVVDAATDPVVNIGGNASLRGTLRYTLGSTKPVYTFRNVRYAEKPVRFLPAPPMKLWDGERLANESNAPWCPQSVTLFRSFGHVSDIPVSEDCLFLDIFTPTLAANAKQDVMVWIHGGGFIFGSKDAYEGVALSSIHDVVVVAINYRLGALGFLSTGDDSAPGNLVLRDQQEALRWVQKHIKYFGGDPDKVTIFGESAGSWSVTYHLLSPSSQPLFRRAISESGSCNFGMAQDKKTALAATKKRATQNGCPASDNTAMLECLRSKPVAAFVQETTEFDMMVDGNYLPDYPYNMFTQGHFQDKDYILGFNENEGVTILTILNLWFPQIRDLNVLQLNRTSARSIISASLGPRVNEKIVDLLMKEYLGDVSDSVQLHKAMTMYAGDQMMIAPILDTARKYASNTYLYRFNYRPRHYDLYPWIPAWAKADHGGEIQYALGYPFFEGQKMFPLGLRGKYNFSEDDKKMSRLMMSYWANFAKTGDPNDPGLTFWPKYTCQSKRYLVLNTTPTVATDYMPERMKLWSEKVPELDKKRTYKGHPWKCVDSRRDGEL